MSKINFDKQLIVPLVLAVFFLIELAVLLPLSIQKISSVNKEIGQIKKNISNLDKEWPKKDAYNAQQESLSAEIEVLRHKLVAVNAESNMLSFISQSGKDYGIEIQSMSPALPLAYPDNAFGSFDYLPVKISARARYHSLGRFLSFLQSSDYFFEVKELSLKPAVPYNTIDITICGLMEKKVVEKPVEKKRRK